MTKLILSAQIIVICLVLSGCRSGVSVIRENNEAANFIKEEKPVEAMRLAGRVAVDRPFDPVVRANLGLALEKAGHGEKAIQEYLMALRSNPEDEELKFHLLFNTARLYGEAKKIDEALQYYQKALEIHPESEEVRVNIELLMKDPQGGGGEGDQKKEQKPQEGDDKQKSDQAKQYQQDKPYQPKPFNSKELSQQDVKNILEELKRQEEKVRGKEQKKQQKESPNGKDW